ncbi:MAG: WYL domain-containing protein [Polyangiaceae bacterium]
MDRVERLRELLSVADQTTVRGLAEALKVSERTVLRDLGWLREQGMCIEGEVGVGGGIRLRRERGLRAVHLTFDEVVSLWLACSLAHKATALPWASSTRVALDKLLASVPEARAKELRAVLRRVVVGPPATASVAQSARAASTGLVNVVEAALRQKVAMSFDYEDRHQKKTRRLIECHGLLVQAPVWYLLARDIEKKEARMFRMDRISRAALVTAKRFLDDASIVESLIQEISEQSAALRK